MANNGCSYFERVEGVGMNVEKYLPYMLVGAIALSVLAVYMVNR